MELEDKAKVADARLKLSVANLRRDSFLQGKPFLILSTDPEISFLEYPDGRIEQTRIDDSAEDVQIIFERVLSLPEASLLRAQYGL